MVGPMPKYRRQSSATALVRSIESLERRIAPAVVFSQFANLPVNAEAMAVGSDGNIWFTDVTELMANGINRYYTQIGTLDVASGILSVFPLPGENTLGTAAQTAGIVAGPDKNLWFTDPSTNRVGFINPMSKSISLFSLANGGAPEGITVGPDKNIWFTEFNGSKIGSVNISNDFITEYPLPRLSSQPLAITTGPDNNLWFTETGHIANFDTLTHRTIEYISNTWNQSAQGIVSGPDNNLWFSTYNVTSGITTVELSKVVPATGAITSYSAYADAGLTVGPDGEIWFVSSHNQGIGEVDPLSGSVSNYPIIPPSSSPTGLGGGIVNGGVNDVYFGGYDVMLASIIPADQSVIISNVYLDPAGDGTFLGGPLADRLVYLDLNHDGKFDAGNSNSITDSNGYYTFTGLAPGSYTVRLLADPGDYVTSPPSNSQMIVTTGGHIAAVRTFGMVPTGAVLPLTFNPSPFGSRNPNVSTAEVNGLYNLILGRVPDTAGLSQAVSELSSGTPLSNIAGNLLHSKEYYTDVAISDYQNYLNRTPAQVEINSVVSALFNGLSLEQFSQDLLSSQEFSLLHATNSDFVQQAYRDTLGREASSLEISAVTALLNSGLSRPEVIQSLLTSPEAATRSINGFYVAILARVSDPSGLSYWVNGLLAGASLVDEAIDFFGSSAFQFRANATVG